MEKAILGKKLGMTQIFTADGLYIPVTVIEAGPCTVTQKKTTERDGYSALQIGFADIAERKISRPELMHLKKAGSAPKKHLREFRFSSPDKFELGGEIKCTIFNEGDIVDVSGLTRGRGFTGVIQRWNHHRLKMTHGSGPTHRSVGSMGANSSPSRVFKGKKLAGQYGHEKVTMQNLEVVKVDGGRNLLLVRGGIPGPKGGLVTVTQAKKKGK